MQKKALASTSSSRWPSNHSATQASNVETLQLQGARRSQGACRHLAQISGKIVPLLPCIRNCVTLKDLGTPVNKTAPSKVAGGCNKRNDHSDFMQEFLVFFGRRQISHWENSNFLGHKSTTTISSFVVSFTKPNWSMSLPSYLQPTGHGLTKLNVIDPFDPQGATIAVVY